MVEPSLITNGDPDEIVLGGKAGSDERARIADQLDDTRTWVDPNGYRLSDRVWLARERDRDAIEGILIYGIATGMGPERVANDLRSYLVDPHRGAYPARRLARTELTRAYGKATLDAAEHNPFVRGIQWRISNTHPEPDECDEKARRDPDGLGRGVYAVNNTPAYPSHPNEKCTLVPVTRPSDEVDALIDQLRTNLGLFPEPAPIAATGKPWLDRIATLKQRGLDESTTREVGAVVRQEMLDRMSPEQAAMFREYGANGDRLRDIEALRRDQRAWDAQHQNDRLAMEQELATLRTRQDEIARDFRLAGGDPHAEEIARLEAEAAANGRRVRALVDEVEKADAEARRAIFEQIDEINQQTIALRRKSTNLRIYGDNGDEATRLWDEVGKLKDQMGELPETDYRNYARLRKKEDALMRQINALKIEHVNPVRELARDVLGEARPFGSNAKHNWFKGTTKANREIVEGVADWMPADWWERSVAAAEPRGITTRQLKRAHYSDYGAKGVPEINIPQDASGVAYQKRVANHEFVHRAESVVPGITDLERAFYERRTAGESLIPLARLRPGWGYSVNEAARLDKFAEPYMGKDYGGKFWEVATMGVEDLMNPSEFPKLIAGDVDYLDFILGLLAGV